MALKPGAGKKFLIIAVIGAALGFGVVKYTGASTKVEPKQEVTDSTYDLPEVGPEETDEQGEVMPVDGTDVKTETPTTKKTATKSKVPVAPKKTVAPTKPQPKKATTAPAPKKKSGERENLDLSNF